MESPRAASHLHPPPRPGWHGRSGKAGQPDLSLAESFGANGEEEMRGNAVQIRPIGGALGAEVTGVDLSEPLTATDRDTIRHTLADRGVVFFRDQTLTPGQHIALARQFGAINVNRFFAHAEGYPEIALVVKEP